VQNPIFVLARAALTSRFLFAGIAAAGAGLVAMNAPAPAVPPVQHRAVMLAASEVDWSSVIATAQQNLIDLQSDATQGSTDLSTALGNVSDTFSTQITTALTGVDTGIQNALYGGWYGGDDGYVFGLFGGTVTNPATGISETNSLIGLLSADFQGGNIEQAYSDFNAYTLEVTDHTLKPLLSVLVDETSGGTATQGIPLEISTIQTNLLSTFADYNELRDGLKALLSPEITAQLVLTKDLDTVAADFAGGDSTQGLSDLNNLSSDVFGAFLNGADVGTNPVDGSAQFFSGLLGDGSLLQHLVLTWPEQIVTALGSLGESSTMLTSDAVSSTVPDLLTGLVGGL
jgi:hypothetical protein